MLDPKVAGPLGLVIEISLLRVRFNIHFESFPSYTCKRSRPVAFGACVWNLSSRVSTFPLSDKFLPVSEFGRRQVVLPYSWSIGCSSRDGAHYLPRSARVRPYQCSRSRNFRRYSYGICIRVSYMKVIAEQAKAILDRKDGRSVAVYFIPRRTIMCEIALENEGVFNRIHSVTEPCLDLEQSPPFPPPLNLP